MHQDISSTSKHHHCIQINVHAHVDATEYSTNTSSRPDLRRHHRRIQIHLYVHQDATTVQCTTQLMHKTTRYQVPKTSMNVFEPSTTVTNNNMCANRAVLWVHYVP